MKKRSRDIEADIERSSTWKDYLTVVDEYRSKPERRYGGSEYSYRHEPVELLRTMVNLASVARLLQVPLVDGGNKGSLEDVKALAHHHESLLSKHELAQQLLGAAADLASLPADFYLQHQPPLQRTIQGILGPYKEPTGLEQYVRIRDALGKRGGANKDESKFRGLVVRMIAQHIPVENLDHPYRLISDLAKLVGVEVDRQNCRGILRRGRT